MVHKPIALKRCDEFFGDQRRSPQQVGQVKCLPASRKSNSSQKWIQQAKRDGILVDFPSRMDFCHLTQIELARHLQKKQRESRALRGDNVKDDGGYKAVFTEKGASASQVAAIRYLATISSLPGMDEQANDAVSAHTQVHLSDAPRPPPSRRLKHWRRD